MTETARAEPDPFEDDDAILATIEPANQPGVARGAMPHGASPLPLYDEAEFAALPEVSWLVEGVLPMSATTLFYGKRGSFKSFIALDLACSVSTGMSWQGREVVPGFVVYVAAEGRAGLIPRLAAWRSHREVSKTGMLLHPEALSLLAPENAARLVTSLQSRLPEGAELAPLLVVFDTLHRCLPGGDENDSATISLALATLDAVRRAYPLLTAVLVHHPTKAGDSPRGSGAQGDDADVILRVERDSGAMSTTLRCEKQRDAEPFEAITLELEPRDGSLVVSTRASEDWRTASRRALTPGEREALVALADFHPEALSWTRWRELAGQAESSMARHRRRLLDLGLVSSERTGHTTGRQSVFRYAVTGPGLAEAISPGSPAPTGSQPAPTAAQSGYRSSPASHREAGSGSREPEPEPVCEGWWASLEGEGAR